MEIIFKHIMVLFHHIKHLASLLTLSIDFLNIYTSCNSPNKISLIKVQTEIKNASKSTGAVAVTSIDNCLLVNIKMRPNWKLLASLLFTQLSAAARTHLREQIQQNYEVLKASAVSACMVLSGVQKVKAFHRQKVKGRRNRACAQQLTAINIYDFN